MQYQVTVNLGNLLLSLSEITDLTSPMVSQHQQRTAFIAIEIAKQVGVSQEALQNIYTAALLHDIGAITGEEKLSVATFETLDCEQHCQRGELLLQKVPNLAGISKIVLNHHRNWDDWDSTIDDPIAFASQVILLADYVERLIDKNKYILHQSDDIVEHVYRLKEGTVHDRLVSSFASLAKKDEFWLDAVSPRLYSMLLNFGPLSNIHIDLKGISQIADFIGDIIDFKSRFTATHTTGVATCAERLSQLMGLSESETHLIRIAGNLHDVGKLVIPNSILDKPGRLTPGEFAVIRSHTYYTYSMVNSIEGLQLLAKWAAYHHERLDGKGYPFNVSKYELDTPSRIIAVADIYTAISEERPYRKGMDKDQIYVVMKNQVEQKAIDARIVDLLFDHYETVSAIVREKQTLAKEFYETRFC